MNSKLLFVVDALQALTHTDGSPLEDTAGGFRRGRFIGLERDISPFADRIYRSLHRVSNLIRGITHINWTRVVCFRHFNGGPIPDKKATLQVSYEALLANI